MRSHTLAAFVFAVSGVTAWQATTLSARSPYAASRSRNAAMAMDRRSVVGGLACALLSAKAQQVSAATESCDLLGLPCTSTGQVDWAKYGLDAKSLGLPTPPAPPAPPPPPPGRAAPGRAAPKPKPGESDRIELAAARAEDKAQAAAERLALKEQAAQAAAEKKLESDKARAAKRAEAEAEAAKRKEETAKKREAEGGKAGRGEMKPAARAAAAGGRSGADTRKSSKQKAEEEAAAKKEKVEQCKKNLWGLPCTDDGEVDRTVFGL